MLAPLPSCPSNTPPHTLKKPCGWADPDPSHWVPSSPRSLEALLLLGMDPESLAYVPLEAFRERAGQADGAAAAAEAVYELSERVRQARVLCISLNALPARSVGTLMP